MNMQITASLFTARWCHSCYCEYSMMLKRCCPGLVMIQFISYVNAVFLLFFWIMSARSSKNSNMNMWASVQEEEKEDGKWGKREDIVGFGSLPDRGWSYESWEMDTLSGNSMILCTSRIRKSLPEIRLSGWKWSQLKWVRKRCQCVQR